jgi:alkanesulfonate monooxygenase SsuD/methylene tetrahydromethanopterin reductase-like flavin-dependent oxidoreductase (luciferase family)
LAGFDESLEPMERAMLDSVLACAVVGSPETVQNGLAAFIARTGADELMITAQIFDHTARRRSFEIVAEVQGALVQVAAGARTAAE